MPYAKIEKVIANFPTMHAYGIGFGMFSQVPEQTRSKAIDYARYMLAYELDDEIDASVSFIKAIGGSQFSIDDNYTRSDYLLHLYSAWRKDLGDGPKDIPVGCMAMATLIIGSHVRVVEGFKPNFLVCVSKLKRERVESYLALRTGFQKWPEDKILWSF